MAAFLKKPSDFAPKSLPRKEPLTLLPPSAFEKPAARGDDRLNKATDEIEALKLQNQRLRDRLDANLSDATTAHSLSGTQQTLTANERRYADELISRQAEEVSKLRAQVLRLENDHQAMREVCDHRVEAAERDREESVMALSDDLVRKEEEYQEKMSELRHQHEGEVQDLQSRLQHLSADLEHCRGDLTSQVADLTAQLTSVHRQTKEKEESWTQLFKEKDAELSNQSQQIVQLKTYITDSEQQHQPQQVWVQQCETLNNKVKIVEAEKEMLESSVQLLNVRLSSMKEILLTQEMEVCKSKEERMDKNKAKELLLTRWRQKVYSLLVQEKSAEILKLKDVQNWKEKIDDLEEKLSSAHNTINLLQHKVDEKEADLQMAQNRNKGLQQQMDQAKQTTQCVEDQANIERAAVQQLADLAHRGEGQFHQQMTTLQQAMGQLKALGQRVSFASSRMDVLRSQLSRKEALKHLEDQQQQPPEAEKDTETEEGWRLERDHLREELRQTGAERDMLAAQLEQDSRAWAEKIGSLKTQYESEVGSLKRTIEDLESSNQRKSQLLERREGQIQELNSELQEARECRDQLGTTLAAHHTTLHKALEEQKGQLEQDFTQHLADLEVKLNDARREHTKAVVTLRQRERQWSREQERGNEVKTTTEAHYQAQIDHLQRSLLSLEKERNLFMATLRQEGLLGKVRKEPMTLVLQEEGEEEGERGEGYLPQASTSSTQVTQTDSLEAGHQSSEPMSAVLEDLRSLMPAVLEDSVNSSEEEDHPTED